MTPRDQAEQQARAFLERHKWVQAGDDVENLTTLLLATQAEVLEEVAKAIIAEHRMGDSDR